MRRILINWDGMQIGEIFEQIINHRKIYNFKEEGVSDLIRR